MRVKHWLSAAALWLTLGPAALAIPYVPPPQIVDEAPIDRALANIAADPHLDEAQRQRVLARLNLLAYMRDDANFAYMRDDGRLNEAGAVPCEEAEPQPQRYAPETPPVFPPGARCAVWTFDLGPYREIPDEGRAPQTPSQASLARLEAARTHYAAALAADDADLRARLGYAYVLDRLGRLEEARAELRELIRRGLPHIMGPQSEWETHAVLTEAVTHLAMLAQSREDRGRILVLRKRLSVSQPMIFVTPVVVPLADAPFEQLVDRESETAFDFAGTGDLRAQGWLNERSAWLVWDPRGRGQITSGFDMIGAVTWSAFWRDGFQVLRALDDDRNGRVDGAELDGLALWRDANANGISDPGEVQPVAAHAIVSLATEGAGRPDLLIAADGVTFADGSVRPLYDWTPRRPSDKPIS